MPRTWTPLRQSGRCTSNQTPAAGEREARSAPVDNQAVVRRLQAGLQFGCWYGELFGFWSFIARLTPFGVEVIWVPARNKRRDWQPALHWGLTDEQCRHLSQVADAAAVEVTESLKEEFLSHKQDISQAPQWARQVVDRQHSVTLPFHQNLVQIMKSADS